VDDKTLQALTVLANKLGTTSEFLWGVLVKQAPIAGWTNLGLIVFWVGITGLWCVFVAGKTAPVDKKDGYGPSAEWESDGAGLAWASVWVAIGSVCWGASVLFDETVSAFLNPEFWALHQLLR
jgi:hypothetical protein